MTARTLGSSGPLASADASLTGGVLLSAPEEPLVPELLLELLLEAPLLLLPLPLEVVVLPPSSPTVPELVPAPALPELEPPPVDPSGPAPL
jgi:hypothetical protein